MTLNRLAPVEAEALERPTNGHPPKNGRGHGQGDGQGGGYGGAGGGDGERDDRPPRPLRRRRSFWPFLLDLGLVLTLFGLIITGRPLMVVGGILFVVALVGWIREARTDFASLSE
jgi:hypothetical protein